MTKITFLGTADALSEGGFGNSAYFVESDLCTFAVDFGPTALWACNREGCDIDALDAVYFTHFHGDHMGGVAQLLLALQFQVNRTRPLQIFGPSGVAKQVQSLVELSYGSLWRKLSYPIEFIEYSESSVEFIRAQHGHSEAVSLAFELDGRRVVFTGDTGWTNELCSFVQGTDVLICEASEVFAGNSAHLSIQELVQNRALLNVSALYLTHMSLASRRAALANFSRLRAHIAEDGSMIEW